MKKTIILLLFFSYNLLHAQTGIVTYTQINQYGDDQYFTLYFDKQLTNYIGNKGPKNRFIKINKGPAIELNDSEESGKAFEEKLMEAHEKSNGKMLNIKKTSFDEEGDLVLTDYKTSTRYLRNINQFYPVIEKDTNFEKPFWEIQTETKVILNKKCQRAICTFKGRKYEAWYSEEIPISYGPWKLSGLPGLILKATEIETFDEDHTPFSYEATSIEIPKPVDNKVFKIPVKGVVTNPEGYKNAMRKRDAERARAIEAEAAEHGGAVGIPPIEEYWQEN